ARTRVRSPRRRFEDLRGGSRFEWTPGKPGLRFVAMRALVSLSIVVSVGAVAHADALRFGRTSISHTTQPLTVHTESVTANAMGWRKCDPGASQLTTRAPALSWDVTEQMELRIRLEDDRGSPAPFGGVIALPHRSYVCANDKKQFWLRNWPRGNYRMWLIGSARDLTAVVHFDNPALEKQQLATATGALPLVVLGGAATTNP